MENRAENIIRHCRERLAHMENVRAAWEAVWDFIARRVEPKNACFQGDQGKGPQSAWRKFDSTATSAIPKWASAMDGLTTPKTQKWHGLAFTDKGLTERHKGWLEECTDILFARRYAAESNFSNANFENLKSIGTYGSGAFSVSEDFRTGGCAYKAWPLREFYVDCSFRGDIDVFYRKFRLSARQARQQFGELCPERIRDCGEQAETFEFLHAVEPNADYDRHSHTARHKKYSSVYIWLEGNVLISVGGYDVCPFFYSRYDTMPSLQDPYGYSPLMLCMPEVKDLNAMVANNLRVGSRLGNPTILLSEDDLLERRSFANGMIVPGGLDPNGRPRAAALELPANLPFTAEMIRDFRAAVNETFNLNLFNILLDTGNMTATEVLQRAQEQATLLSPTTSRRESEFLSPLIKKELEIAFERGAMPEPPPEVLEAVGSGDVGWMPVYESPIRRAQKADEGTAVMRVLETAAALQQWNPEVKNKINSGRSLEIIAEAWGAPGKMFNTEEEQAAKDMEDAQLAQAQQILQAAPLIGKTAKDLAQAQQLGSSAAALGGGQ